MRLTTIVSITSATVAIVGLLLVFRSQVPTVSGASDPSGLSPGSPAEVGFAAERLNRIDTVMQSAIDQGTISGVVTLVARKGRIVQNKAYGMADRDNKVPMRTDSIFRLASVSKIITTVALMQLMEEGHLRITDPISKFLPGFAKTTVAVPVDGSSTQYKVVPAARQMTVHDVLTKTTGISYPIGPTESLYEAQGFHHIGTIFKNGKMGFGFNVEINIPSGDADRLGSVGDYGWAGAYFPRFLVDPSERLLAIFMGQLTPYGGASDLHDKFTNGVYQALLRP